MKERICKKGIWNNTIPGITFDKNGNSNYSLIQEKLMHDFPRGEKGAEEWENIVSKIKQKGKGKKYDCIIGISGGTDSSYLLHIAKEKGLKPLAVILDNGWTSDIAVKNVKKLTDQLSIDLETYVIDYNEVKDVLKSYMYAALPWIDNPTDQAIHSVLYIMARREKVKYILMGTDFRSEGKQPTEWTYSDSKQLRYIHKKYGTLPLKSFPILSYPKQLFLSYFMGYKVIAPFNYIDYEKEKAQVFLTEKYDWEYYGGHHYENVFTKWTIAYWMYEKFNIDKRLITLSAQVLSGAITRDHALNAINEMPYTKEKALLDTEYVLKKLELTKDEFEKIWKSKNNSFLDYPSYYPFIIKMLKFISPLLNIMLPNKPKIIYEIENR